MCTGVEKEVFVAREVARRRRPPGTPSFVWMETQRSLWLRENFPDGESNSCGLFPITATTIRPSRREIRRKQLISSSFA